MKNLFKEEITKHFTLSEFLDSYAARMNNINLYDYLTQEIYQNIVDLCVNLLEPLRQKFQFPIIITSGFRNSQINMILKGSKTSDHLLGKAADVTTSINANDHLLNILKNSDLKFKQCIYYIDLNEISYIKDYPKWLHLSYDRNDNRCEILRCDIFKDGSKKYEKG